MCKMFIFYMYDVYMNITPYLTECVTNNKPVTFVKYGDGEFNCMFGISSGSNCDGDKYTHKKKQMLINSFKFFVNITNSSYIGLWHNLNNSRKLQSIVQRKVKWVKYHTIIFDKTDDHEKVALYKAIRESSSKKIIVCNNLLEKSGILFEGKTVFVSINNWFETDFVNILNKIKELIGEDGNHIVITCCGMAAKILIAELMKCLPNGIYLDFGSALDIICTKKDSRGRNYGYEYFLDKLNDIIPDNWEDEKYNEIYEQARTKLGIHL
jgi:hypothetical protein